ncbi:sensor histidine kinase [Salibacter halophilus]|uniref:histidine kinase n=1 Tax=Salibacter halophilus TaxID=1803916 RepID=A0A6N6MA03_9FLAO|nr:HAMP domain-containing sensor histidine kinase [Salibacter halophilus]KAB1063925.1 HAMP domain-containing histidine kinase [Salibacter halophilus]
MTKSKKSLKLGLGTRIYLSMMALILISLIVIGISTYAFFQNRNEQFHQNRLQQQENTIMLSLQYFIIENGIRDVNAKLENKIHELAEIHDVDLNVYTTDGELLGSTQVELFEKGVFSKTLPDSLLHKLKPNESIVKKERLDGEEYLSAYFILENGNKKIAIINLPYRKDSQTMQNEVSSFLLTLAQVYVLLFLFASIVAFLLSNYITNTLKKISAKLKEVRINKKNEPIEWNSKDEIGELINDYNRMLEELEKSAQLLAKSERESAWKEMARQVAHEIKNPLTPMRLNIQHLQRTAKQNPEELEERIQSIGQNLIEQIDTLSSIASEFSNFAKMPKAQNEKVDVKSVLNSAIELHRNNGAIDLEVKGSDHYVFADKQHLLRAFTNLIKNGLQAVPDEREPEIKIFLEKTNSNVVVKISDNGSGIPDELKEKIFSPNFTTKSSGMGLGLAMVKNIVNAAGGEINFQTKVNEGTTFTILLPLSSE